MEYVYHLVPEAMKGRELYPLAMLEEKYPDLAKAYTKDYKGREYILNRKIDLLDATWKDVLFLSCVNPILIFSALELFGLLEHAPKIIRFPVKVLKNLNACYFSERGVKNIFEKFNVDKYQEETRLPIETLKYFIKCTSSGEDPLIFSGVKHILLADTLNLNDGEVFSYKPR